MADLSAYPFAGPAAIRSSEPWHKNELVLRTVPLQYLNDNGFINFDKVELTDEGTTEFGQKHAKNFTSKIHYKPGANPRFHPLFHRSQWRQVDLNDEEFERLEPVFQLATLLLEEESMASYMYAMIDARRHRDIKGKDSSYKWFRRDQKMTSYDHFKLWTGLKNLVGMHFWKLWDLESEADPIATSILKRREYT